MTMKTSFLGNAAYREQIPFVIYSKYNFLFSCSSKWSM